MATRKQSTLTSYAKLSPNCTKPRNAKVRRLTPHCAAGNPSIEGLLGLANFVKYNPETGASTSYGIGTDGRIGLGVEEINRPWTTSSRANDMEAITFEITNDGKAPDWHMSDAAINSWLDLAFDIASFYGFKKVNYKEKPPTVNKDQVESWIKQWAKDDEMIITLHTWYVPTKSCPGPYFIRQIPWLVKELNARLSGKPATKFTGEGILVSPLAMEEPEIAIPVVTPVEPIPEPIVPTPEPIVAKKPIDPITKEFEPYNIRITTSALNVRKGPGNNTAVVKTLMNDKNLYTIIEEAIGPGATAWGKLKSGLGWVSLDYVSK